jgi:hypothetical protein
MTLVSRGYSMSAGGRSGYPTRSDQEHSDRGRLLLSHNTVIRPRQSLDRISSQFLDNISWFKQ